MELSDNLCPQAGETSDYPGFMLWLSAFGLAAAESALTKEEVRAEKSYLNTPSRWIPERDRERAIGTKEEAHVE